MFWTTIQIVLGIITPFLVIAFLIWLLNYLHIQVTVKRLMLEAKLEEIKKSPPYDDIKISQPPNLNMSTVTIMKNGKTIFEQSYDKEYLNGN